MTSVNQGNQPDRIERDIEATRSVIKEDIQALGEKLSPDHLKREAVQTVKGTASEARHAIVQRVDEAEDRMQRFTGRSRDRIEAGYHQLRRNPLALAGGALVFGLSVGLLLPTSQAEARLVAKPARRAREQAQGLLREGRETAQRVRDELQEATADAKGALLVNPRDDRFESREGERRI